MTNGKPPLLTVGMATSSDLYGVWQTVNDLRLIHPEAMPDTEIIVVDNAPHEPHGKCTMEFMGWVHGGTQARREGKNRWKHHPHSVKYVAFSREFGTTQPREEVFRQASGKYVLCIDCHVALLPGALNKLLAFYESGLDDGNLIQGVMVHDDLEGYDTHFDDKWRGEMWGTWGSDPRGADPDGEPFEVPAQGLGLFSCRKDAWLGFNPRFRGFGGEEWYIHDKYRKAGKKTLCLPFLRWLHRFWRPDGVRYHLGKHTKVRNYVIGCMENGVPLDRLRRHFVEGRNEDPNDGPRNLLHPAEWEALMLDLGGQ